MPPGPLWATTLCHDPGKPTPLHSVKGCASPRLGWMGQHRRWAWLRWQVLDCVQGSGFPSLPLDSGLGSGSPTAPLAHQAEQQTLCNNSLWERETSLVHRAARALRGGGGGGWGQRVLLHDGASLSPHVSVLRPQGSPILFELTGKLSKSSWGLWGQETLSQSQAQFHWALA